MGKDYFGLDPKVWKVMSYGDSDDKKGEIFVLDTTKIRIGGGQSIY